jgi:hypothetical protein
MNFGPAIDASLEQAEQGTLRADDYYAELSTRLPELFTFFFDEDTRLLMEPEHDYLLFVGMILLNVMEKAEVDLTVIDIPMFEAAAEDNWGYLEYTSIEGLTEALSDNEAFDLYVFLEDACAPAEDHEVLSEAAVELVYVKCKTLIDLAYPET